MKNLRLLSFLLFFIVFTVFVDAEEQEEIDYLLFLPNSSDLFVDEEQALAQLDNMAKFLLDRDIAPGQINVYGYAAFAANDIDPVHLSRNRALFVIDELQKRGVPQNLFSVPVGHGEVDLWGSNIDEDNKIPNRRVRVVLNGSVLVLEQSTGQVIESEVPAPVEPEAADSEITISSIDIDETPIKSKDTTVRSNKTFPRWILLPLLLLLLIPFLFSKLRKKSTEKTIKPEKVITPAPAPPAPTPPAPTPAVPIPIAASETVKPAAVPAAVSKKAAPQAVETIESVVYLEEEIRQRAYEYSVMRNGENGSMDGDWYKALPEIRAKYEDAGYTTYSDGSWWARKTFTKNA
ncbi:MAG: hypothetical protein LBQ82_05830 [Treponema sp.]|jgi:hypothetical protein|nr:hypothetical protein [Treponema sp.]